MAGVRGLSFPFRRGVLRFPEVAEDDDCIASNIRRCLMERRGSRVMRSGGSNLWAIVFENTGALLRARIDYEVRRAIEEGEPRALIQSVEVQEKTTALGDDYVDVTVVYNVRGVTNQVVNSFPR